MKISTTIFRQITLVVFLFFAFSASVWGATEATLSFANKAQRTSFSTTQQVWEQNGITFLNDKGSGNNVADYANPVRLYANSKITIEAPGNITKIVFDCNSSSYATALKNSIGNSATASSDKVTVALDGSSTSFIIAKLTAQVRMDALTVTYVAPTIPTLKVEPISINFGDIEQNEMVGDQEFTLTGSNLTNEITLELSNTTDFSISKSVIPIDDANSTQSIKVTLNSTENIGVKEGKITISSKGVESQIIDLYANVITPKQRFNINFYHNGEIRHTLQIAEGESIGTFPSIDGLVSCNPNLPIFVGWTSEYIGYENVENKTAPNFFDPTTPINHDVDLYAVFADASATSIWYHVKNISDLTDGSKVLIVCQTKDVAAGEQYGTYRKSTPVSLSNNQVTDIQEAKIFTLGVTSSGYTFYSDDEKHYLSYGGSGNALNTVANIPSKSNIAYWNISISNDITKIFNSATATFEIQYNASSPRFACYKSTQQPIALYKLSFNEPTKWTICIPYAYSATFHINANSSVVVNDINPGTAISDIEGVPTLLNTCDANFWSFAGWTTATETLVGYAKPEIVATITDDVNLYPVFSNAYAQLATDASQLQVNDKIIIVAKDDDYALSTNQRENNRGQIEITKIDNKIGLNDSVQIITLQEGSQENTFVFYVVGSRTGYLYAASSSNNYLKTRLSLDENGSTDWNISITNSIATLKSKGTYTHNMLGYNASDKLFSCYSGSQKNISIYEIVDATQWIVCNKSTFTIESDEIYNLVTDISVDNLTIKSNYDQAGQINVTAGTLKTQKVIVEKTIDASRYYFFSLPFDCNINDIVATSASSNPLTYYKDYTIFYYDQKKAANNKGTMGSKAWVEKVDKDTILNANQGYIIGYLVDEDTATIKFKSLIPQTISAPATTTLDIADYTWYTDGGVATANGWNLIGLPYYQNAGGTLAPNMVSIPNDDGTYTQTEYVNADIAPFTSFFVQTKTAPVFSVSVRSSAPMLRASAVTNKAVISFADANGGKDQTTIINNPNTTADYEIGHDLVKWIGYAAIPQIYSIEGDDILAFNSLAMDNSTVIPLGVYAHADGEYTFALDEKSVGDLQGWELYDNEVGATVRLVDNSYGVYLEKGTHEGRFELRLQQRIATDCGNTMGSVEVWTENGILNMNNMPTDAVVYVYDAVGRMVDVINPNSQSFSYDFVVRGVYNIVISSPMETIIFKTIY